MPFLAEGLGAAGVPAEVVTKLDAEGTFLITLASLAAGAARQSAMVGQVASALAGGPSRPAAMIYIQITSGPVAPTAATTYEVYLIRGDGNAAVYRSDGAGVGDAAITIENAQLLGTIVVTATANKAFFGDFDTSPLGILGQQFGIAVKNNSGQALHATPANHYARYTLYVPEVQ